MHTRYPAYCLFPCLSEYLTTLCLPPSPLSPSLFLCVTFLPSYLLCLCLSLTVCLSLSVSLPLSVWLSVPPVVCRTVLFTYALMTLTLISCPHGLTITWWGCCGLCLWHKPTKLAHSFLFCSCVCFCLYGPFNCISFHKLSRQLFAFSLGSSGLNSALLVLSTIYLFMKLSLSPDVILCGWLGLKHQLTN